jgi:mRNA interferase MazF
MPLEPVLGEVWRVDLEPTKGAEMRKIRPVVVINSATVGKLPLRIIVPFTDWKPRYGQAIWTVRIVASSENGLSKTSAADTFQSRAVSISRFISKIGTLTAEQRDKIAASIANNVEYTFPSY